MRLLVQHVDAVVLNLIVV